jgi:hypothetical protein
VGCGGTSTKTYYSSWAENIYGAQLQIIQNNQSYKVTFQETTDNPDEVDKIRKRSLSKCITEWELKTVEGFSDLSHGCFEVKYIDLKGWNYVYLENKQEFLNKHAKKFNDFIARAEKSSKEKQLVIEENKRKIILAEKKEKIKSLELKYLEQCKKFKKETSDYENCLFEKQKLALVEQNRLATMPPSERYAYTCEKTYGFKKGSDNFRDCVFKIMTTEYEMQNQLNQRRIAELERKVVSNQANTAYQNEMLEIERMKAKAMQDQVNFARNKDVTDTLLGISNNLLNPPRRPAPNAPQMFNCQTRKFGGFDQIQCF